MEIIISTNSNKPIYEQIAIQIKAMVMSGELTQGQAIPSMRALAKSLHISVITVQKAYEDLQRDGFIELLSAEAVLFLPMAKHFIRKNNSVSQKNIYSRLQNLGVPVVSA